MYRLEHGGGRLEDLRNQSMQTTSIADKRDIFKQADQIQAALEEAKAQVEAQPQSTDAKNTLEAMKIALDDSIPSGGTDPKTWGEWLNLDVSRWEALLAFAQETGQTDKLLTPAQVWDGSLMKTIFSFDRSKLN